MGQALIRVNRPAPSTTLEIFPAEVDLRMTKQTGNTCTVRRAIKHLKNGKAARPDHVLPKALKADINITVEILYKLFEAIWIEEVVPNDWKLGNLIKIPKKGDIWSCDNYIGEYLSCRCKDVKARIQKACNTFLMNRRRN